MNLFFQFCYIFSFFTIDLDRINSFIFGADLLRMNIKYFFYFFQRWKSSDIRNDSDDGERTTLSNVTETRRCHPST